MVNHPDVHPWVALPHQGYIDCTVIVEDERNYCFDVPHGCFLLIYREPGLYEAHSNFLPEGRGVNVFVHAKKVLREMFLGTECMEIVTQVPSNNEAAKRFIPKLPFKMDYQLNSWPTREGNILSSFYSMSFNDWIREEDSLADVGKWFHESLEAEKKRHGIKAVSHPDERFHDIRVGASIEMARRGQVDKGLWLYNRWAKISGYQEVKLLRAQPLIVDIEEAIVKITDEVEICQPVQ